MKFKKRRSYWAAASPDETVLVKSGELAVPVIGDIVLDRKSLRWLMRPGFILNLPEGFAVQIRLQHAIQKPLVQAYQQQSKKLLLQALLLGPVVDSAINTQKLSDYMLDIQADYLPELH